MKKAEEWLAFALPEAEAMQDTMEEAWEHMTLILSRQSSIHHPSTRFGFEYEWIGSDWGVEDVSRRQSPILDNGSDKSHNWNPRSCRRVHVFFQTESDNFVMNLEAMENTGRLVRIA